MSKRHSGQPAPVTRTRSKVPGGATIRVADMSVPPEQRRRPKRTTRRTRKAVPDQLGHGNHGNGAKDRPQREREMHRRRARG
jgi:hypothetical protein